MRTNWNIKLLSVLGLTALLVTGCGGIQASKSVSPASFFLPGIMQVTPTQQDQFVSVTGNEPVRVRALEPAKERSEIQ